MSLFFTPVCNFDPGLCVSVLSKCLSVYVHTVHSVHGTVQGSAVQAVCLCPPPPRYSPAAHHSLSPLLLSPRLELIYYSVAARSRGAVQSARCRARGGSLAGCSSQSSAQLGVVAAWPPSLLDPWPARPVLLSLVNGQLHLPPMDARVGDPIRCAEN